jgi:hypothetical protein
MSQLQSEFSFTILELIYYLHVPILLLLLIFTLRLLLLILYIWCVQYGDVEASIINTKKVFLGWVPFYAYISYLMYVKYKT